MSPAQIYLMDSMPSVIGKGLVLALLALYIIFQIPLTWKISFTVRSVCAIYLMAFAAVLFLGLIGLLTI